MIGQDNSNEIELNLPHGCCHLFCESARGVAGAVSFAGLNVEINGEIKIISDPGENAHIDHPIALQTDHPKLLFFQRV